MTIHIQNNKFSHL